MLVQTFRFGLRTVASQTRMQTASVARIRRTPSPSRAPMMLMRVWLHGRTVRAVRTPTPPPRRPRLQLLRRPRHAVSGFQRPAAREFSARAGRNEVSIEIWVLLIAHVWAVIMQKQVVINKLRPFNIQQSNRCNCSPPKMLGPSP